MKITELFDGDLFRQMCKEGFVNVRGHDNGKLFIANYSDKCQYASMWNNVTLNCRGLIFDANNNIISRGFGKFFNLGDAKSPFIPFDALVEVTDKMDGSLGILYWDGEDYAIATRGSFNSDQAKWATEHWRSMNYKVPDLPDGRKATEVYTFLFEIIY